MGVKAFAGTGKSATCKEIVLEYPDFRFLGLVFNNSMAKENGRKFPKRNSEWFTVHTFSKTHLKKISALSKWNFSKVVGEFKPIEVIDILQLPNSYDYELAKAIKIAYTVFCNSGLKEINPDLMINAARTQKNNHYLNLESTFQEAACDYAGKLWTLQETSKIPLTHDFYLKWFERKGIAANIDKYDFLLLDEAQDSNPVTMSIVSHLPTKDIMVGDEHQSIYGFRGTINALDYSEKIFNLSTTFRYSQEIADKANKLLEKYKSETVKIKSKADISKAPNNTAYLSRNNSTMIDLINQFVEKEEPFKTIKDPKDIFETALALLDFRLMCEKRDNQFDDNVKNGKGIYQLLKKFKDLDELKDYMDAAKDDEFKTAFNMQKRFGKRLFILQKKAREYYKSKDEITTFFSTAHSSKGLEWGKVELLDDFKDINQLLKDAHISSRRDFIRKIKEGNIVANGIAQELNLEYVATTRAMFEFRQG